ncbi:MAG: peptidoglycan DD-metalloendopeptidase family protein [Paraclostridium sp.]
MASVLQNLEAKEVIDHEIKSTKLNSTSKFKSYRKKDEDKVKQLLGRDQSTEKVDEIDPYSKERRSKTPSKSKVMTMSNNVYQSTLLEKILQSQSNPELVASNLQFQSKTLSLLSEMKDLLTNMQPKERITQNDNNRPEHEREISSLAKNIAELNISGLMNDFSKSAKRGVDKYGILNIVGSMTDMIKETVSSGSFGDIIKDSIQDSVLGLLGNKNKTIIKNFKDSPLETIQDLVNVAAMSKNKAVRGLVKPFYRGNKIDPVVERSSKDVNASAVFDNRTHTTINEVIPDILTKMLAISEGKEQRKFNHDLDKWETISQILERDQSKDTVSKYTDDTMDFFRELIQDAMEKSPELGIASSVQIDSTTGKAKANHKGKILLQEDQVFIELVKNLAKSNASITDLANGKNVVSMVDDFGLARGITKEEATNMLMLLQTAMKVSKNNYDEIDSMSKDLEDRKKRLRYIHENPLLKDLDPEQITNYMNLRSGVITKKEYDKLSQTHNRNEYITEERQGKTRTVKKTGSSFKVNYGNAKTQSDLSVQRDKNYKFVDPESYKFGTINSQKDSYNLSSRGVELTKEEKNRINVDRLHSLKLIDSHEYKSLLNGNANQKLISKVESQIVRYGTAQKILTNLKLNGLTADQKYLNNPGTTIGYWESQGLFKTVDQIIPYIKDDGTLDLQAFGGKHEMYNEAFFKDLDKQVKSQSSSTFNFDIADPMKGVNEVLDDVFTDPSLVKKLGIGTGTAAGLALGKIINNKTFIKNPKLGWMLGAIGGGIMSMERTQNYLTQTFGPNTGGDGGYSNREIFIAKLLNRWLPAVGVGGKAAQITYKMMSKMGPAGQILGPVASLLIGGAIGGATPWLLDKAKERMFNSDKDDKGILKKIGNAARGIPFINDFFSTGDNREESAVLRDTVNQYRKKTEERIEELNGKGNKRTDAENDELKKLSSFKVELDGQYDLLDKINNIKDDKDRAEQYKMFLGTDFLSKNKNINDRFQEDLVKQQRKNELGDASKASLSYKSTDDITSNYAKRELERKYSNVDISKLNESERRNYDTLTKLANDDSIRDMLNESVESYLESNGHIIEELAEAAIEGENMSTMIGPMTLIRRTDEKGNVIPGLMEASTKEEFNMWLSSLPEDKQKHIQDFIKSRQSLYKLRNEVRDVAAIKVDALNPTLSPVKRDLAIDSEVNGALTNSDNIMTYLKQKTGMKISDITNKVMDIMGEGGISDDDISSNRAIISKLESFLGGGQGSKVNELVKMKDLKGYKLKNGSRLSIAGCSIVAINNALNYLSLGGISIEYLTGVANTYLTSDGGVTSNFFKHIAKELNILCKTYNSVDNEFNNQLIAKFKPSSSKAVIALIKNPNGGSHFINITAINERKVMIDDPERVGITEMSTSTLVASLTELIVLEKTASKRVVETNSSSGTSRIEQFKSITKKQAVDVVSQISKTSQSYSSSSSFNELASNKINNENVVNVRIVEDMTLPLKMGDVESARYLESQLNGTAKDSISKAAIKKISKIRKNKSMTKDMIEQQKVQEDTSRIADAVEGNSTGMGGAGSGIESVSKPSEGGFFSKILSMGAILPAAMGILGMSELWNTVKKMFSSSDEEGGDGKDAHSANKSGFFARSRHIWRATKPMLTATSALLKGGVKGVLGRLKGGSKNPISYLDNMISKFTTNTSKRLTDIADSLLPAGFKKLKNLAGIASSKANVKKIFSELVEKAPSWGKAILNMLNGTVVENFLLRIAKGLGKFVGGFLSKIGSLFKKGFKNAFPGLGIMIAAAQITISFNDGFSKAHLWLNRDVTGFSGMGTKVMIGVLKAIWDTLPDVIAGLASMIPGIGTAAAIVATMVSIYIQDWYAGKEYNDGFERFLVDMGLRESVEELVSKDTEDSMSAIENQIPTTDGDGDVSDEAQATGTKSIKIMKGVTATQDKSRAKVANSKGYYKFTGEKQKNDNANRIYPIMKKASEKYGLNTSMAMAQWAQESGWGTSGSTSSKEAVNANALFGVKKGSNWTGKTVMLSTTEVVTPEDYNSYWKAKGFIATKKNSDGKLVITGKDEFRAYDSVEESVEDYMKLKAEHYKDGLDGYATDPNYAKAIKELTEYNFNIHDPNNGTPNIKGNEILANGFTAPMDGLDSRTITSAFGPRGSRPHRGIDFRANIGEPVYAIKDGVVETAGVISGGGNTVTIRHSDGSISEYMHLDTIGVKPGQKVTAGINIGKAGNTGRSGGPHLHLGIKKGSRHLDPLLALGLNPNVLKVESSPENTAWKKRNSEYVQNFSGQIQDIAQQKVKMAKVSNNTSDKGGPVEAYHTTKDEGNTYRGNASVVNNIIADDRILQLEKKIVEQNDKLTRSLDTIALLLSKIVSNTDISSNNLMNEAMGLTR